MYGGQTGGKFLSNVHWQCCCAAALEERMEKRCYFERGNLKFNGITSFLVNSLIYDLLIREEES